MVTLRSATLADRALLADWDTRPHVVVSHPDTDWGWEETLTRNAAWEEQLVAEVEGVPIGYLQIIDPALEESHYWGEIGPNLRAIDIWIGEQAYLGRGFGTEIMKLAIARCFANPAVEAILLDPLADNVRSHRFYERLGFRLAERREFGEDDCCIYRLDRP